MTVKGEDFWMDELEFQLGKPLTPTGRDCLRTWLRAFSAHVKRQLVETEQLKAALTLAMNSLSAINASRQAPVDEPQRRSVAELQRVIGVCQEALVNAARPSSQEGAS